MSIRDGGGQRFGLGRWRALVSSILSWGLRVSGDGRVLHISGDGRYLKVSGE